jgi:hypothetical protein
VFPFFLAFALKMYAIALTLAQWLLKLAGQKPLQ